MFWLSVTRNLLKAQSWNKSVLTSDRCRPHSLTFGLFEPGKYLWELSGCVPYIGIPCQCIRFDMSNAADTNSLDRRSEGIITVFKNILHVQRLRYFERKQTQQKTVFWKWIKIIFMPITSSEIPWTFIFFFANVHYVDLEILVLFNTNLPAHLDDHAPPTYKMTFGFKPFSNTLRVGFFILNKYFYVLLAHVWSIWKCNIWCFVAISYDIYSITTLIP